MAFDCLKRIPTTIRDYMGGAPSQEKNTGSRLPKPSVHITDALQERNGGKRAAPEEDPATQRARKRQAVPRDSSYLRPDYSTGFNATTFGPSRASGEMPPHRGSSPMAVSKPVARASFVPRDTLNEPRYYGSARAALQDRLSRKGERQVGTLPLSSTSSSRSHGQRYPWSKESRGDGFMDDPPKSSKKQRLSNGHAANPPKTEVVELDSDEDANFGNPIRRTIPDIKVPPASAHIDDSAYRNVDIMMRIDTPKRKRRDKASQGSSQTSNRATPEGNSRSQRSNQQRPRPPPNEVTLSEDGDNAMVLQSPAASSKPDGTADSKSPRSRHSTKMRRDVPVSVDAVADAANDVLVSSNRQHAAHQGHPRDAPIQRSRQIQQTSDLQTSPYFQTNVGHDTERLNDKFLRDKSHPKPQPASGTTQRMQIVSNRISLGSEDELTRDPNVWSQTSRNVSPTKRSAVNGVQLRRSRDRDDSTSDERKPSAEIRPTIFTHSGRGQQKAQQANLPKKQVEQEERFTIDCILSRPFCLQQKELELVWHPQAGGFSVHCADNPLIVPSTNTLMWIGDSEINQWLDAEEDGYLMVQVKGSKTKVSQGSIIIGFADRDDLVACREHAQSIGGPKFKFTSETRDRMERIVKTIGNVIWEDHKKPRESLDHHDTEIAIMEKRRNKGKPQEPASDDEIKYDGDNTLPRASRRSQMHAAQSDGSRIAVLERQPVHELRKSGRQTKPPKEKTPTPPPPTRWTQENKPERWSHSVVYPPEGTARRVTVDFQDLERLDEGEFLNDNIISFALRRIEENMAPEHKDAVLFFSSFFYTALTTKNGRKAFNYDAVKRWTKNKDVFNIPYIVVPINIDLHWFVAIICNLPNLTRQAIELEGDNEDPEESLFDGFDDETQERTSLTSDTLTAQGELAAKAAQSSMRNLSLIDNGNVDADDEIEQQEILQKQSRTSSGSRPSSSSGKKLKKKAAPRPKTYNPEEPAIITLDSFGSAHPTETRMLKDYVSAEGEVKRGMTVQKEELQGMTAKGIPQQTNFCDCGVYLVGYIEQFAKDPRGFVSKALEKKLDEQGDFASFDPSEKRTEIRNQLLQLHDDQSADRRAKKSSRRSANDPGEGTTNGATQPAASRDHNLKHVDQKSVQQPANALLSSQAQHRGTTGNVEQPKQSSLETISGKDEELETQVPRPLGDPLAAASQSEQARDKVPPWRKTNEQNRPWKDEAHDRDVIPSRRTATAASPNPQTSLLSGLEEWLGVNDEQPRLEMSNLDDQDRSKRQSSHDADTRSVRVPGGRQEIVTPDGEPYGGEVIPDSQERGHR